MKRFYSRGSNKLAALVGAVGEGVSSAPTPNFLNLTEININQIKSYRPLRKNHYDYSYGGWYMIKCIENGMVYIGKSIEPIQRIRTHMSIKTPKQLIDKEINRIGIDGFRFFILDNYSNYSIDFFNRKMETLIERKYIELFQSRFPNGFNIS